MAHQSVENGRSRARKILTMQSSHRSCSTVELDGDMERFRPESVHASVLEVLVNGVVLAVLRVVELVLRTASDDD